MLKKEITYIDYNDEKRTDELYFNLSKAELLKLETRYPGGLQGYINKAIKAEDSKTLYDLFETIIELSYGVKSDDGKRFIKTKEQTEAFMQSEAFSELVMEIITDADAASAFISGLLPKDMQQAALEAAKQRAELGNIAN